MKTINFNEERSVKILLSGPSGSGKTTLIKTLPKSDKPNLYLDFENGSLSIKSLFKDGKLKGIFCNSVEDIKKLQNVELYKKYNWIIIDSLTGVCSILEKNLIGEKLKKNVVISYKEWGLLKVEIEIFLNFFKNIIPNNVLFTTRTKNLKNNYEQKDIDYLLPTSARETIKGEFDIALYLAKIKGQRVLITEQSFVDGGDILTAKVRDEFGKIKPIEEADLGKLIQKLI